jgi:GDP-D-mannose dehydratase
MAKAAATLLVESYRDLFGLFACSGFIFTDESRLRPDSFVTQRIAHGAAAIKMNRADRLNLGNLQIVRDWGWAEDYVECMARMLQQDEPRDYVVATGVASSLESFVDRVFRRFTTPIPKESGVTMDTKPRANAFDADKAIAAIEKLVGDAKRPVALHEPQFAGREWEYVKETSDTGWVSSVGKYVDELKLDTPDEAVRDAFLETCHARGLLCRPVWKGMHHCRCIAIARVPILPTPTRWKRRSSICHRLPFCARKQEADF